MALELQRLPGHETLQKDAERYAEAERSWALVKVAVTVTTVPEDRHAGAFHGVALVVAVFSPGCPGRRCWPSRRSAASLPAGLWP